MAYSLSEMFSRVIVAVDASRGEAEVLKDADWMRYCEDVLFPFLEAEMEKAQREDVADLAEAFAELATNYIDRSSPAATQLIGDASLRRARARLEAAGEE